MEILLMIVCGIFLILLWGGTLFFEFYAFVGPISGIWYIALLISTLIYIPLAYSLIKNILKVNR